VDADTKEQVADRTQELLLRLMSVNDLDEADIISILFTATADVTSAFPATVAREIGFGAVPLLCAAEIPVPGATPLCIRLLAHVHTDRSPTELHHVYLHGAQGLRDDLPS
jgi:chorismate mutase